MLLVDKACPNLVIVGEEVDGKIEREGGDRADRNNSNSIIVSAADGSVDGVRDVEKKKAMHPF